MGIFELIASMTDGAVAHLLAKQVKDKNSPYYGGYIIQGKGFAEPGNSWSSADVLLSAYFNSESEYYKNSQVLSAAICALEYLISVTHPDGTIDLIETNFHDATCNGFAMKVLGYTYQLVKKHGTTPDELRVLALIEKFAELSTKAMYEGGFHTPNHRWVVASGMAFCHSITKDPRCIKTIEAYLSEGIDCNEEGDYTERSVGIYDAVNNNALIILATEMNKTELLEYVRRNLNRIWYYVESDFTAQTLSSRRQDYGKDASLAAHLWAYSFMANMDDNPQYAWMSHRIQQAIAQNARYGGAPAIQADTFVHLNMLTKLLLMPELNNSRTLLPMPESYKKIYPLAGSGRFRSGKLTATVIKDNPVFLKLQYGHFRCFFKLACTFFGHGKFIGQELVKTEYGFRLSSHVEWGYRRPLVGVSNQDWFKLPHEDREKANWQHHDWIVDVVFAEGMVELHVNTDGTEGIPWKLEMILEPGGVLYSGGTILPGLPGGWAVLGNGCKYSLNDEHMQVNLGLCDHEYGHGMRNAISLNADSFTVYHTGFTPACHQVKLKFGSFGDE